MKERLCRRLTRLEEIHRVAQKKTSPCLPTHVAADIVRQRLAAHGFAQTVNESLAETMARAFGMNSTELRAHIHEMAAGNRV